MTSKAIDDSLELFYHYARKQLPGCSIEIIRDRELQEIVIRVERDIKNKRFRLNYRISRSLLLSGSFEGIFVNVIKQIKEKINVVIEENQLLVKDLIPDLEEVSENKTQERIKIILKGIVNERNKKENFGEQLRRANSQLFSSSRFAFGTGMVSAMQMPIQILNDFKKAWGGTK